MPRHRKQIPEGEYNGLLKTLVEMIFPEELNEIYKNIKRDWDKLSQSNKSAEIEKIKSIVGNIEFFIDIDIDNTRFDIIDVKNDLYNYYLFYKDFLKLMKTNIKTTSGNKHPENPLWSIFLNISKGNYKPNSGVIKHKDIINYFKKKLEENIFNKNSEGLDKIKNQIVLLIRSFDALSSKSTENRVFIEAKALNDRKSIAEAIIELVTRATEEKLKAILRISMRTKYGFFEFPDVGEISEEDKGYWRKRKIKWRDSLKKYLKETEGEIVYVFRVDNHALRGDPMGLFRKLVQGSRNFEIKYHDGSSPNDTEAYPPRSFVEYVLLEDHIGVLAMASSAKMIKANKSDYEVYLEDSVNNAFVFHKGEPERLDNLKNLAHRLEFSAKEMIKFKENKHNVLPRIESMQICFDFEQQFDNIYLYRNDFPESTRPIEWLNPEDNNSNFYLWLRDNVGLGNNVGEFIQLEIDRNKRFEQRLSSGKIHKEIVPKYVLDAITQDYIKNAHYLDSFMYSDRCSFDDRIARLEKWISYIKKYSNYHLAFIDTGNSKILECIQKFQTEDPRIVKSSFMIPIPPELENKRENMDNLKDNSYGIIEFSSGEDNLPQTNTFQNSMSSYIIMNSAGMIEHLTKEYNDLWNMIDEDLKTDGKGRKKIIIMLEKYIKELRRKDHKKNQVPNNTRKTRASKPSSKL
jgi:hypothetical protein